MKLRPGNMKATFKNEPFPHVLLKNYYTDTELDVVREEAHRLDRHLLPPEQSGSATHPETKQPLKFNSGLFLSHAMPNSEMISFARRRMKSELIEQIDCKWWTDVWKRNNVSNWLISRYSHGQYYNAHVDMAQFTMLIWFYDEPKPFTGGDLVFPDYDNYTIPCDNNTGIIFFGAMRHEVPPISGNGRYTLTCFTSCQSPTKQ